MTDRGSMLPLYLGLASLSLALTLLFSQLASANLFRQQLQISADQLALFFASSPHSTTTQLQTALAELQPSSKIMLSNSAAYSDSTVKIELCGTWQPWFKLPFLNLAQKICTASFSR